MQMVEVGNKGPSGGYIFYDVDVDNDATNDGRGLDNLSSETNTASGDMPANWRYLEAAEYDIKLTGDTVGLATSSSDGTTIIFGYYREAENKGTGENYYANAIVAGDGKLSGGSVNAIAIGTGAANTENLVKAMKEDGSQAFTSSPILKPTETIENYAANVCSKLEVEKDGTTYDDWFLPSKDELKVMYENLQDQTTPLGNLATDDYWSSSESTVGENFAWYKYFGNNSQSSSGRNSDKNVRAIRAF